MNDMNFFAPLQISKEHGHKGKIMPVILIAVLILIVAAPILGFGYEFILNSRIASVQKTLNAPENKATLDNLDALQVRVNTIKQSLPDIQKKDALLGSAEWLTEKTLQVLVDTVPKQVTMNIMTMADGTVQLDGTAVDKPAIAEMEYNLRKSGIADAIMVSYITKNEGGAFSYAINFTVKDVNLQ